MNSKKKTLTLFILLMIFTATLIACLKMSHTESLFYLSMFICQILLIIIIIILYDAYTIRGFFLSVLVSIIVTLVLEKSEFQQQVTAAKIDQKCITVSMFPFKEKTCPN